MDENNESKRSCFDVEAEESVQTAFMLSPDPQRRLVYDGLIYFTMSINAALKVLNVRTPTLDTLSLNLLGEDLDGSQPLCAPVIAFVIVSSLNFFHSASTNAHFSSASR